MTIRRKVIPLERWIVDQNRIPSPVGKLFDADSRSPPWKAPFVILSNGHEHWFWNFERALRAIWSVVRSASWDRKANCRARSSRAQKRRVLAAARRIDPPSLAGRGCHHDGRSVGRRGDQSRQSRGGRQNDRLTS